MRRFPIVSAGFLLVLSLGPSLGCGPLASGVVRPGWRGELAGEPATRLAAGCRYLGLHIQFSNNAAEVSERDERLGAEVAELMGIEFARRGFRTTADEASAHFSLLILAGEEEQLGGFVFTALMAIREGRETHQSGLDRYAPAGAVGRPTFYHGLSWGPRHQLRDSVRAFVQQADAALHSRALAQCELDRRENERDDELESQVAEYLTPL